MLNTLLLSQDNYSEVIKEDLISFVEIELIPIANSNLFTFSNKDINNTKIEAKQESEQYRFDIDPRLTFENCTINNLIVTVSSYTSYVSFHDCNIETLIIEIAADRYTDAIYFTNTNAKTVIIKELEPKDGMLAFKSRRSYQRQIVFNSNIRNCYTIINNLIIESFSSKLKNRFSIKTSPLSNTIIEDLTVNNYIIDSSNISGNLYADSEDQPQLVIKKLNLDNVSVTGSRNLNFKNISIEIQELNTWKRLEEIKSKTRFISRLSKEHPRFDVATLILLSQVFATIKNTGSIIDNEVSKLNIPGVYADKTDTLSSIQILPQTKLEGAEVQNQIIHELERTLNRDIMRAISNALHYLDYKSTITLEDLDQINFLINKTLRSKLDSRADTEFVTISLDDHFRININKSEEFFNRQSLINEGSTRNTYFNSIFSDVRGEEERAHIRIRGDAETVVALNRNRDRTRSRTTANPTFRIPETLRNIVDTPIVTPTNFDPAFLQNRTTAVNTPQPEETDNNTLTFRDAAEEINTSQELRNSISEAGHLTLLDSISNGGYGWDIRELGVTESMLMPRDPLSSLQMNVEAYNSTTPNTQYNINIFSESDED